MKRHHYKLGSAKCYSYMKPVGHGWEVGFCFGKETVFVGNFIHPKEATKWWGVMNREMKTFTRRYSADVNASWGWYTKFFSHHLYKCYYSFLDQQFSKYQTEFARAVRQDEKKYKSFKGKYGTPSPVPLRKSA